MAGALTSAARAINYKPLSMPGKRQALPVTFVHSFFTILVYCFEEGGKYG
jgi:hypothetical protein